MSENGYKYKCTRYTVLANPVAAAFYLVRKAQGHNRESRNRYTEIYILFARTLHYSHGPSIIRTDPPYSHGPSIISKQ
eukprot:6527969-Pyramimonas_sp.AAC.1